MLSLVFILSLLVELKIHFQGQIFTLFNVLTHLICCHHFAHFTQSRSLLAKLFQMSYPHDLLLTNRLRILRRMELPFLHLKIHTMVTLVSKLLVIYWLGRLLLLLLWGLKCNLVQLIRHWASSSPVHPFSHLGLCEQTCREFFFWWSWKSIHFIFQKIYNYSCGRGFEVFWCDFFIKRLLDPDSC